VSSTTKNDPKRKVVEEHRKSGTPLVIFLGLVRMTNTPIQSVIPLSIALKGFSGMDLNLALSNTNGRTVTLSPTTSDYLSICYNEQSTLLVLVVCS